MPFARVGLEYGSVSLGLHCFLRLARVFGAMMLSPCNTMPVVMLCKTLTCCSTLSKQIGLEYGLVSLGLHCFLRLAAWRGR